MNQKAEKFLLNCIRSGPTDNFKTIVTHFFKEDFGGDWKWLDSGFYIFLPIYLEAKRINENLKIPKEIEETIKQRYIFNVGRNEEIRQAMVELEKKFNTAKIDIIFLKGAALLTTVYKDDIGIRPMADIDILVRKKDLAAAEDLLGHIDYKEDYERLSRDVNFPVSRYASSRYYFHYVYFKGEIRLELHWDVSLVFSPLIPDKLFESSKRITIEKTEVRVLSPEAAIFIACLNFIKDFSPASLSCWLGPKSQKENIFYHALFFFNEIKKMLKYYGNEVSWDNFLFLARTAKNEYEVLTLLFLAQKIAKANIPDGLAKKIKRDPLIVLYVFLCRNIEYDDLGRMLFNRNAIMVWTNYRMLFKNPLAFIKSIYGLVRGYLYFHNPKGLSVVDRTVKGIKTIAKRGGIQYLF